MARASKHVQPYPPEFRAEAIRLARTSGKSHAQIAQDLGTTSETLRLWLKQADLDAGKRHDGLSSEDQEAQWHQQVMFSTQDIGPGMMSTVDYTFSNAMMHQQLAFGCYTANGQVIREMPIHMSQ
jgi:Transposase